MRKITQWGVGITVALLAVYDFIAYYLAGGSGTESTTVGTWMSQHYWVLALWFILCGHLSRSGDPWSYWHWGTAITAFLLGRLITS